METGSSNGRRVRFGAFEADLQAGKLRKRGIRMPLQEQPFRILALLLARSGEVVSREELRSVIRSDDPSADLDHNLNTAVNKIREALGDSASHPRFVETVPRRGYKFVYPIRGEEGEDGPAKRRGPQELPVETPARETSNKRERLAWIIAAVATIGALAIGIAHFTEPSPIRVEAPPLTSFTVHSPAGTAFAPWIQAGAPTISPDGSRIVAVVDSEDGTRALWVRSLASQDGRPIPGTDGATYPFWSPDSRQVAFFAEGELKRVAVDGGTPQSVCDAPNGRGGAWSVRGSSDEGVILFAPNVRTGLHRVSPNGGKAIPVTTVDQSAYEQSHRRPSFLPDGEHFFYVVLTDPEGKKGEGVYLTRLDSAEAPGGNPAPRGRRLLDGFSKPAHVPLTNFDAGGYILRVADENLMAQQFDSQRQELIGAPRLVATSVRALWGRGAGSYSASSAGALVVVPAPPSPLVWFNRAGEPLETVGDLDRYAAVELSPDGGRVALEVADESGTRADIEELDLVDGQRTKITSHSSFDGGPIWSSDGRRIAFHSYRRGRLQLYSASSNGVGDPRLVAPLRAWSWDRSRDDQYLLHSEYDQRTGFDLWVTSLDGDRSSTPFIEDESTQNQGQFSPGGRYVAYTSMEAGLLEVYVQPFPATGDKFRISVDGGSQPRWGQDGAELFYIARDGMLMSVEIEAASSSLVARSPRQLFRLRRHEGVSVKYDVSADGRRFLVSRGPENERPQSVTVMLNWGARLTN